MLAPQSRGAVQPSTQPPAIALWPEGAVVVPFENLEGAIAIHGRILVRTVDRAPVESDDSTRLSLAPQQAMEPEPTTAYRDTSGPFVLDTGAGHLVLDLALARALGLTAMTELAPALGGLGLASLPVDRLEVAGHYTDSLSTVLLFDAEIVRRTVDRPVLGLLGREGFGTSSLIVDYARDSLAFSPGGLPENWGGITVPFELAADSKIIVKAALAGGPPSNFILDTGATKTVVFRGALTGTAPGHRRWLTLRGLYAPTVGGDEPLEMMRIPGLGLGVAGTMVTDLDIGVVGGPLEAQLSRVTGRPIAGLLGYSYLKHFQVGIDYGRRQLLLRRIANYRERRPYEFSTIGIQLSRVGPDAQIVAIVAGGPAEKAGLGVGDRVLRIGELPVEGTDLLLLAQAMEGPPGTTVDLEVVRGEERRQVRVTRRRLL
jgi:hypothetical protein